MNSYLVTWQIDVEAETPQDAARAALAIQRNPKAWATVFDVHRIGDDDDENSTRVDLGWASREGGAP